MKKSVMILLVVAGLPGARASAQPPPISVQHDPLDPIAPKSQAECTALGNEWDQRIKAFERQHSE